MKPFLYRLALFLLPLALLVAGFNILIDPAGLYRADLETAMAAQLLAGQPVGVNRNYNERRLQRLLAPGRATPPTLLILGSSTSMEFSPDNFCLPTDRAVNASVNGAALEDLLGVYALYSQHGPPAQILIEVPPRLLVSRPDETRWRDLAPEVNALRAALGWPLLPAPTLEDPRLTQLLSPALFQEALGLLASGRAGPPDLTLTPRKAVRYPYGSQVLSLENQPDAAGVARLAAAYLADTPAFPAPDEERVALFADFVAHLSETSQVAFYLPPFNPAVFAVFGADAAYGDYLARLYRLAEAHGIPVFGSLDPAALGLSATDYRDGVHLLKPALDDFFTPLGCRWAGE